MDLGLCSYSDYNAAVEIGRARLRKESGKTEPAPEQAQKPAIDFGIASLVSDLPGGDRA